MDLLIALGALAFLMFVAYRGYSVILFAPRYRERNPTEELSEMSIMLVAAIVARVLLVAAIGGGRLTVSARRGSGHDFGEMSLLKSAQRG
jgi:hypothetical protein